MVDIGKKAVKQEITRKIIAYMMVSGCWHCHILCDEFDALEKGEKLCAFERDGKLSSCVNAVLETMQNNPDKFKKILKVINNKEEQLRGY